jgi:hypothetical protein
MVFITINCPSLCFVFDIIYLWLKLKFQLMNIRLLLALCFCTPVVFAQTTTLNPTGTGAAGVIQQYIVPPCATQIRIEGFGAQGGNTNGGLGARMRGDFNVTYGDTIFVVVGQQGTVNSCGGVNASSGGGGGSFVWKNSGAGRTLLLVAGGGGGGNTNWAGGCIAGINAVTTNDGTQGNGPTSALGGTAGNGGFGNAPSGTGSGGAGWLSVGQNSTYGTGCTGGLTFPLFTGGTGSTTFGSSGQGDGGFGGGGGAVCGNGGGGGYSGGGGGEGSSCRAGGGGGGSYNIGINPSNSAGIQTGSGLVTIEILSFSAGNILSASLSPNDTVCAGTLVTLSGVNGTSYVWNNGVTNGVPFAAASSLAYQLIGLDTAGCLDTVNLSLLVHNLPNIQFAVNPNDTVCAGTSVTASGTGGINYTWNNGITNNGPFDAFSSANYVVVGVDANGCANNDTLNLVVNPNPTVSLGADIVQPNPPAILNAGAGFSSYLWSNTATTQTISVSTNGSYIVTATNANGCSDTDTIQVFFTAGIEDADLSFSDVTLYPNPSSGWLNLRIANIVTQQLIMDITDLLGQVVYSNNVGSVAGELVKGLDVSHLAPGNYIVRLHANNKTVWLKMIKQ